MDVTFQALVQAFGPAGLFIGYLIYRGRLDREDAEKRRQADIRLALSLDRFCRRFVGQNFPSQDDDNVQQG